MVDTQILDIDLPKGWMIYKLRDLVKDPKQDFVDGPFGSNLKSSEYKSTGIPLFRIQNIKAGYFVDKNIQFVSKQKAEELKRHSFRSGDIIITKLGDPLGLCCPIPNKYPFGIIVADLMRVRLNNEIVDTNYIIYLINSKIVQNQFKAITKGTTRARVNLTIVRDIEAPIPPLKIQNKIVSKIEELFSELDKGIENLKLAQQQLKVYRQSVLKWAFEGRLTNENVKEGELPEGWKTVRIMDIAKIETGTTPSKANPKFYGNDFPLYKPTDLEAGKNVLGSSDGLTKAGLEKARYAPENSTLITCIGATIGKTGFIKKGGGFNQQINAIIPFENVNPKYIYYQAIGKGFQTQILANSSATTLPIINKSKFQVLTMRICSPDEQISIVNSIEARLSNTDKMEESINQGLQKADVLRQSILQRAFEGMLI